jgi:hypothetical protein
MKHHIITPSIVGLMLFFCDTATDLMKGVWLSHLFRHIAIMKHKGDSNFIISLEIHEAEKDPNMLVACLMICTVKFCIFVPRYQ